MRGAVRGAVPAGRRAPVLGALGVVLALASVLVATQGRVLLHQCVTADGPLAALGVRLAVLRSAVECPDGSLSFGAASQGAVLLLSVAVPVLAVHVLLAACGIGLGVAVRRGVAVVAAVLVRGVVPTAPVTVPLVVPARVRVVGDVVAPVASCRALDPARPHRGPPSR